LPTNGEFSNGHVRSNGYHGEDVGSKGRTMKNGNDIRHFVNGEALLRDADALFGVGAEFFELPVEEKQKYDFKDKGSYFGYKGYGAGIIDKGGMRDRNEFYNVSVSFVFNHIIS